MDSRVVRWIIDPVVQDIQPLKSTKLADDYVLVHTLYYHSGKIFQKRECLTKDLTIARHQNDTNETT